MNIRVAYPHGLENTETIALCNSILSGACVKCLKAGYTFSSHLHSNIEIYRILSGTCYMNIQSETVHCQENDFIMLLPNVVHSFYLNVESDCSFQHIHFDPDMFSGITLENNGIHPITLLHAVLFSSQFYYHFQSDSIIDEMLSKLIKLYTSSDSLFSSANINVALINIMMHILDRNETKQRFNSARQRQNSYVAYTLNYIQAHYTDKIKQEDIASQLHISVRYLSSLFKTYIGISLSNYINIYRINCSIDLMQKTNLSLTDIAVRVGFNDSHRYSKVFMKVINSTPSQYRKSIIK